MTWKKLTIIGCLVPAALAFAEEAAWKPLFDGKTLEGWSVKSGYATYEVEDGAILGRTVEGSGNTFLVTAAQYGDFELEFEVKVDKGLNSGVQIRSLPKGDMSKFGGRITGPQVEIENGPGQSGWIYGEATGKGWLSPEPELKDREKNQHDHFKNGEWNQYRVVAKGPRIQTWINGEMVADLTDEEIYADFAKGHIGLQVHGVRKGSGPFEVRWRNLRIRELD